MSFNTADEQREWVASMNDQLQLIDNEIKVLNVLLNHHELVNVQSIKEVFQRLQRRLIYIKENY